MRISSKTTFDSNVTLMIKGIAIILMVCNHLFPIFDWIYPENMYISIPIGNKNLAAYIGGFSKICVSIFALLTGISMYYCYTKKGLKGGYSYSLRKLPRFFLTYWLILVWVYIPIMLCAGVYNFDIKELILNLFGYKTTYCRIAWYVRFYLELVLTFPIFCFVKSLLGKLDFIKISWLVPAIVISIPLLLRVIILGLGIDGIIVYYIDEYLSYVPIVLAGYFIAEYKLFDKAYNKLNSFSPLIVCVGSFFALTFCFLGRGILTRIKVINTDLFFAPLFILILWLLVNLIGKKVLFDGLIVLGKYSLEIWFLHAIFFIGNSNIQHLAYWPKVDILILIWVVFICLVVAILFRKIEELIIR